MQRYFLWCPFFISFPKILKDIVQCCLMLNDISTYCLYLETVFLLLTYLGICLFYCYNLFPLFLHRVVIFFFSFFFLAFSLTIKVTNMMAICQDICWQASVDFTYIDFNIFLLSMSFSSKGSMRSVKSLQTHYLGCIYQLVPLSQWDSFVIPAVITGRLFLNKRYNGGHKKALIQKASDKHSLRMMLSLLSTVPKFPSLIIKKNNNFLKKEACHHFSMIQSYLFCFFGSWCNICLQ